MKITRWVCVLLAIVAFVAAEIYATKLVFRYYEPPRTAADYGNAFGFVNAVVSGLALLAVAYTLKVTRDQIRDGQQQFEQQQRQLQQNTEVLEAQKNELARQVAVMGQQAFDTRFFQLLALLQSIVDSLEVPQAINLTARARAAFKQIYSYFQTSTHGLGSGKSGGKPDDMAPEERRQQVSDAFRAFYRAHTNDMGHFFRTLYHVVLYVDRSTLSDKDKYAYVRLVRAQLSQHQLTLLFYNGLTSECGWPKCFRLIKEYRLLKNMDKADLIVPGDLRLYEQLDPPEDIDQQSAVNDAKS